MFAKLSCVQSKFISKRILQRAEQHTSASAMNKLPPSYHLAIIMLMAGHTINLNPLVVRLSSSYNDVVIRVVPK